MKKILKNSLLGVALLAAITVNAADEIKVNALTKQVNVSLTEVNRGEKFSILDRNGVTLFSELLKKNNDYEKTFDFSNLPEGVYFLESKESEKIDITPVIITEKQISIIEGGKKEYKAPKFSFDKGIARVVVDNKSEAEVAMYIYNSVGIEILATEKANNKVIMQAFDFKQLPNDTYTIVVQEDDYTFSETINL